MINQIESNIPEAITSAATAMLKTYVPGLTPEKLAHAIIYKPEEKQETLLTRKEAATSLHVSLPTIDRCLREKQLNAVRVRGRTFIRQSEVDMIIAGGK